MSDHECKWQNVSSNREILRCFGCGATRLKPGKKKQAKYKGRNRRKKDYAY